MKNLITIILAILLFLLSGCGEKKQSTEEFITVDVTKNYPKKELILQDMFDVEYIPLETSDEFVTSAKIQESIGKNVMVFTNEPRGGSSDIFIFDRSGKGLRKFNRAGQGGEEYVNIQDIVLDEDNHELYVNSTFSSKVLVYDLFGNFKRSFLHSEDILFTQTGNFDQNNLICYDAAYSRDEKGEVKTGRKNCFLLISKQDGGIKEIPIPYEEKKTTRVTAAANGKVVAEGGISSSVLIPYRHSRILTEISADTIYRYSPDHGMTPFIVRAPSIQSMNPEVFLFPGVTTDRYCFMQTIKKVFDFVTKEGFPRTDLIYDRQENAIFECAIYNDDFTNKTPVNLVFESPRFRYAFGNNEIAFIKRLDAFELVEAYEKGQLKGRLKEIAATLDEESNPVIMLVKHKK